MTLGIKSESSEYSRTVKTGPDSASRVPASSGDALKLSLRNPKLTLLLRPAMLIAGVRGDSGDSILPLYERLIELRSNFQLRAIQIRALVHAAIDRG